MACLRDATQTAIFYCEPVEHDNKTIDFQYVWGNKAAYDLYGLTPETLPKTTMLQLFPKFVEQGYFDRYLHCWLTGEQQRFKRPHPIAGLDKWVEVVLEQRFNGVVVTAYDITEQERLFRKNTQQAALLQNIVDHSPNGIVLFQPIRNTAGNIIDFRYVLTNPVNAQTVGRSVAEITGKNLLNLFPTVAQSDFFNRLVEVEQTGQTQHHRNKYEDHDMSIWVDATLAKLDDGILLTYQNISSQVQKQNELEKAREVAENAVRTHDEFLANISHEIRNPLNAILGFAELLEEELTDTEQVSRAVLIRLAGHTVLKIINNLLDVAQFDSNQFVLEAVPLSLVELTKSIASLLKTRAQQKNLAFQITVDPALPPRIIGDSLRLTQILLNLCDNAIKFTSQGHVRLNVALTSGTEDHVCILFQVVDTGVGIPHDRLPHIFNRYQQASADVSRRFGGTGLGLNIVQNLVKRMNGHIEVESTVGIGTTFSVTLPFVTINESPQTELPSLPKLAVTELIAPMSTILLVEDNTYNQRLVQGLLKHAQVNLLIASNGMEALSILRRQPVDLVFLDIQMPLMNGYSTAKHIRTTLHLDVPIVALTGNAFPEERNHCLKAGMTDYLSKPFQRQALFDKITQYGSTSPKAGKPITIQSDWINEEVLHDLYLDELDLLKSQVDQFDKEWPEQCALINELLERGQQPSFSTEAHRFGGTLNALGLTKASQTLQQLASQFSTLTFNERSELFHVLIEQVEQGLACLFLKVSSV
ncbi:hypothetical protein GCM10028807_52190 [Spirosoma daeguense]